MVWQQARGRGNPLNVWDSWGSGTRWKQMHLTYKCMFACVYVCVQVHAHMHICVSWGRIQRAVAVGRPRTAFPSQTLQLATMESRATMGLALAFEPKDVVAFQYSHWLLHGTCNTTFLRPTLMTHELNMPGKITISAAHEIMEELIINWDSMFESIPWLEWAP